MAPFDCDAISYIRHHKLMDDQYNINSIAEAVVNWGICDDFPFIGEYYNSDALEHIDDITTTVSNFLMFFEEEFQQIISKHCNGNMSEEQFVTFVRNRCDRLGKISAYFGFIMPCAFMRETIYRFKYEFGCSNFFVLAQECLAKFLVKKFKEFENDISWSGFMSYCEDINTQFSEKVTFEAQIIAQFQNQEQDLVEINIMENPNSTIKSADVKDEASNTFTPLEPSNFDMPNSNHMSGNGDNENDILSELTDGTFIPNTTSDEQRNLSQAISETCFESENDLYWRHKYDSNNDVCFSHVSSDISSNNRDSSEATVDTFISNTKSNKTKSICESMSVLHPVLENGSVMNEENVTTDGVASCDISSVTRSSTATCEEFFVLYSILMPDDEFAVEVFNCLSECLDFDDEEKLATS